MNGKLHSCNICVKLFLIPHWKIKKRLTSLCVIKTYDVSMFENLLYFEFREKNVLMNEKMKPIIYSLANLRRDLSTRITVSPDLNIVIFITLRFLFSIANDFHSPTVNRWVAFYMPFFVSHLIIFCQPCMRNI